MSTVGEILSQYTNQGQISNYFLDKMGIISILSYSNDATIYDGITSASNYLALALLDIPSDGGIIFLPSTKNGSTYKIDSNITIPSNVSLWFATGAKLSIDSGKILTINGQILAGSQQIFSGDGSVLGSTINDEIYPEWFGAKGDYNSTTGIGTDDSVAFGKAIALMMNRNTQAIVLSARGYKIDNTTFYLNSTATNATYTIRGQNLGTTLYLYNYSSTYLFVVNENSSGTQILNFPGKGRFILEKVRFDGQNSTGVKIVKQIQLGGIYKNLEFESCETGIYNKGYSDNVVIDNVKWFNPKNEGWCYESTYKTDLYSSGDSLYINQLFSWSYNRICNTVKITLCGGATIQNCNGGHYEVISSSGINILGGHFEFTSDKSSITVAASHVNIKGGKFYNNNFRADDTVQPAGYSPIIIDDYITTGRPSIVTIEDNQFTRENKKICTRPAEIEIKSIFSNSSIKLRNNKTIVHDYSPYNTFGIKVTCTQYSALNTLLQNNLSLLHKDIEIKEVKGTWGIYNNGGEQYHVVQSLNKPTATLTEDNTFGDSLIAGTYYYKIVPYTVAGKNGMASDEYSIVKTGAANISSIKLDVLSQPDTYLFVYRGTASDTYNKVAVIPIVADRTYLLDNGTQINGFNFVDVGTTIPAHSVPQTVQTDIEGVYNLLDNNIIPINSESSMSRQAVDGNFQIAQVNPVIGTVINNPPNYSYPVFDMWKLEYGLDGGTPPTTIAHSQQKLTSGAINNAFYNYRISTNGSGSGYGVNSNYLIRQYIENGTRYLCGAGKKVTLSFWARSTIANKKIGVYLSQGYGTGGAPTSTETINGYNWTLTSVWTKYLFTFTTNTLTGKTFGTNNDDTLLLSFALQWGSSHGARVNSNGISESFVGSGDIEIAQVQLNAGNSALPFAIKSFDQELESCQRYFSKSWNYEDVVGANTNIGSHYDVAATVSSGYCPNIYFKKKMRINPTVLVYSYATGASGKVRDASNNADRAASASEISQSKFTLLGTGADYVVGAITYAQWTADARF